MFKKSAAISVVVIAAAVVAMTVGAGAASAAVPCPADSSFNPKTQKCEASPTYVCPDGTAGQEGVDCIGPPAVCPDGYDGAGSTGVLCSSPFTGELVDPVCPSGYVLALPFDCVADPSPRCSTGLTYNASTGLCEAKPSGRKPKPSS